MSRRAVLFDAGNTLVHLDYPRLAARVSQVTGLPLTGEGLQARSTEAALLMERANATDRERASRYLEQLFILSGVPQSEMTLVRDTLYALHKEKHLWSGVDEGIGSALDRLRQQGVRLGVVSNSDGRADEALIAAAIRDRFEFVVDSQLVGFEKPDPRIFDFAFKQLGFGPGGVTYIGDLYEVDVVGARNAGMDAILLDPDGRHLGRDVRTAKNVSKAVELLLADSVTHSETAHGRTG